VNTLQKGLSPLFDIYMGEGGEGGYPHGSKGGGMGGIYRGGVKKNPYVIIGGEGVYLIYPNKVINMTG